MDLTAHGKPPAPIPRLDRRALILSALALPSMTVQSRAQDGAPAALPRTGMSSDALRALLTERVEIGRDSQGYVGAIRDADGTRLVGVGSSGARDGRPLSGDTVFEIGSITKVFTALLLADMVARNEVALTDPVAKYLPPEGRPRPYDGKPMTLLDLATYTSGLPRMPANFAPKDPANPYVDYTEARLYAFLSGYAPQHYPGSQFIYANLGFGLLGHVLALRAGQSYEELVVSRICAPLGLDDTRITLTPSMHSRLAPGHDTSLRPVPGWEFLCLAGAGALRSTANDLLRFLEACQGRRETSLAAALASLLDVRRQADQPRTYAAGGWFVRTTDGDEVVVKDGGTGGYATYAGYSTRTGIAVVLLANTASYHINTALGRHMLNAASKPPPLRRAVPVEPAKLERFVGRYPLQRDFVLTVTQQDGRLMARATGQDAFEIYPESDTRFFYRVVDAQITFEVAPDGTAAALTLHQNGRDRRGVRSR